MLKIAHRPPGALKRRRLSFGMMTKVVVEREQKLGGQNVEDRIVRHQTPTRTGRAGLVLSCTQIKDTMTSDAPLCFER